jgi:lysozyme
MTPSSTCADMVRHFEGFRSSPYLCPAGKPTIGYGATHYLDGVSVTLADPSITEERASVLLVNMLLDYGIGVSRLLKVSVSQGQFDALVGFAYNLGVANLSASTLMKLVNGGSIEAAALEFGKWVHADGKVLPGLVARREAECMMFLGEI